MDDGWMFILLDEWVIRLMVDGLMGDSIYGGWMDGWQTRGEESDGVAV